jgi:Ca2+:H+ antiporter
MIVLNGIVGVCPVAGAGRHCERAFRVQGAASNLSVIATVAVMTLILPNFTTSTKGPTFAESQLLFVGAVSLALYVTFVFVQTVRHRDDFVIDPVANGEAPGAAATAASAVLLSVSLVAVILLAKALIPVVAQAVSEAGLPLAFVGVAIATVVLFPEGVTALRAARANRMQTSLNAPLGSALASIGLTVPIVGGASVLLAMPPTLGLGPEDMVLLVPTLSASGLTFATGRTTVLQGAVHLVIFGVFLVTSAVP